MQKRYSIPTLSLLMILALFVWVVTANAQQRGKSASATAQAAANEPRYDDYKGVKIGMRADEVHKLLGDPTQSVDEQDFYIVSPTETVQVCYDKSQTVHAISTDYFGAGNGAPDHREVVGGEVTTRDDGSTWKLVRYEKSGFWVSYNRTAGTPATVTVTIQRISRTARAN